MNLEQLFHALLGLDQRWELAGVACPEPTSPVRLTLRETALFWSEEMYRIFGLNPQEGLPSAEVFWQRIHPEDLDSARELLMQAAHRSMDYEHEHRIVLSDGTVKHIHAIGHGAPGGALSALVTIRDMGPA